MLRPKWPGVKKNKKSLGLFTRLRDGRNSRSAGQEAHWRRQDLLWSQTGVEALLTNLAGIQLRVLRQQWPAHVVIGVLCTVSLCRRTKKIQVFAL